MGKFRPNPVGMFSFWFGPSQPNRKASDAGLIFKAETWRYGVYPLFTISHRMRNREPYWKRQMYPKVFSRRRILWELDRKMRRETDFVTECKKRRDASSITWSGIWRVRWVSCRHDSHRICEKGTCRKLQLYPKVCSRLRNLVGTKP